MQMICLSYVNAGSKQNVHTSLLVEDELESVENWWLKDIFCLDALWKLKSKEIQLEIQNKMFVCEILAYALTLVEFCTVAEQSSVLLQQWVKMFIILQNATLSYFRVYLWLC